MLHTDIRDREAQSTYYIEGIVGVAKGGESVPLTKYTIVCRRW